MTRKFFALTTAALVTLGAVAPSAQAMETGEMVDMITGKVYRMLEDNGIPTDSVSGLSLNQIVRISLCEQTSMDGDGGSTKACIEAAIRNQ